MYEDIPVTLLDAGCDVPKTNTFDEQPIHLWGPDFAYDDDTDKNTDDKARWGTTNTYYEVVRMLKDNGLKVLLEHFADDITKAMETIDRDGYTPLTQCVKDKEVDSASILVERVSLSPEMIEILSFYLDHGLIDDVDTRANDGYTPLHFAAVEGHTNAVKFLCARGCDVNARTAKGSSPLHLAAKYKRLEAAKALIEAGCKSSLDSAGMRPGFYALQSDDEKLIKLFKSSELDSEQPTSDVRDHDLFSKRQRRMAFAAAFEDAILGDNLRRCRDLIASGCDLEVPLNSCGGCSPLVKAIEAKRTAIVVWLLEKGASLTKTVCHGHPVVSAIHLTVRDPSLIEVLPRSLARYASSEDAAWGQYPSLIHTAAAWDNLKALELLLKHLRGRRRHHE
ncbi:Serine/threonine-protein phosphatase 6 regulatory ankyrin repeat subunit B [Colletotrichum shisoi]|uniref:Serine/threonine-protein phosphatase 6 regulatory ankyrin repeat subunit B n=1 Tax=Colletotrichum shisoi TaxID=2078593 RepID=A0A5Q4BJ83_9PEZI|nr:Serine/threonine-protein phosphatase 6 regulatory ankyrin repeat subunit B [Colletotrichum shisoi]